MLLVHLITLRLRRNALMFIVYFVKYNVMKNWYILINGKDVLHFSSVIAANDCFNAMSRTTDKIDLKLCFIDMSIGSAPTTQSHYTNIVSDMSIPAEIFDHDFNEVEQCLSVTYQRADEIADLDELDNALNPNN